MEKIVLKDELHREFIAHSAGIFTEGMEVFFCGNCLEVSAWLSGESPMICPVCGGNQGLPELVPMPPTWVDFQVLKLKVEDNIAFKLIGRLIGHAASFHLFVNDVPFAEGAKEGTDISFDVPLGFSSEVLNIQFRAMNPFGSDEIKLNLTPAANAPDSIHFKRNRSFYDGWVPVVCCWEVSDSMGAKVEFNGMLKKTEDSIEVTPSSEMAIELFVVLFSQFDLTLESLISIVEKPASGLYLDIGEEGIQYYHPEIGASVAWEAVEALWVDVFVEGRQEFLPYSRYNPASFKIQHPRADIDVEVEAIGFNDERLVRRITLQNMSAPSNVGSDIDLNRMKSELLRRRSFLKLNLPN